MFPSRSQNQVLTHYTNSSNVTRENFWPQKKKRSQIFATNVECAQLTVAIKEILLKAPNIFLLMLTKCFPGLCSGAILV